jgi:hypothetical protein
MDAIAAFVLAWYQYERAARAKSAERRIIGGFVICRFE